MKSRKSKRFLLTVVAFLVFLGGIAIPDVKADSFGYRMSVTVNSSQVQNGPLTNFPFLFNTTSTNLKTTANGGHVQNVNGYDIIFRALDATTCGGTAPCTLDHEIEKYDGSTGEFVAWVRVPSVNNGTVLYIYYGNASITSSPENKTGVWDSNYKGVWHLGDLGNAGTATFSTKGSSSWTVPAGVTSVTVKAWGAGGGSGSSNVSSSSSGAGGGGGFAQGTITTAPGESLTVYVGGGGAGGVLASSQYAHGGGGGGYSAVTRGSTYLIQAGGGGGGSGAGYTESGKAGGAGGGASGIAGSNSYYATGGGGGTSSAGGTAGTNYGVAGSANQGGGGGNTSTSCGSNAAGGTNGGGNGGEPNYNSSCVAYASGGGGGGGGRYGGGGGGTHSHSYYSGAGGGGGSDLVTGTSTVETAGSGTTPGNNTDSDYTGSVGVGGAAVTSGSGNAGNDGYVVITWGVVAFSTPGSSSWTVPTGVTSITVRGWGGGGGGGGGGGSYSGGAGGGGGFAQATLSVTPGDSLTVYVGGGGSAGTSDGSEGGGGGGGGYSAVKSGLTFSTPGSSSWTVPTGVTSVTVKAWGAGGGGGGGLGAAGGGAGFAQGTISVTPGETLTVYVGGGGGGGPYSGYGQGGGGGGYSAVIRSSTYLVQAGGGGGGGGATCSAGPGGAGGGNSGIAGTNNGCGYGNGGGGGTSSGGGAGGSSSYSSGNAGSANQGGAGDYGAGYSGGAAGTNGGGAGGDGGGGGGGGKYGGGGGAGYTGSGGGAGGGGGSDLVTGTGTVETAGSGTTPGNNTDLSYPGAGVGVGGTAGSSSSGAAGGNGCVVITWGGAGVLIQAGGGGGGGGGSTSSAGGAGGAGGGSSGSAGTAAPSGGAGGGGGTSSTGGSGGYYAGSGGSANIGGGGGNGGMGYGGAAGTNGGAAGGGVYTACCGYDGDGNCICYNSAGGGGGGGGGRYGGGGGGLDPSYYYGGGGGGGGSDLVTGAATIETAGSGTTPGNNTDVYYKGTVGAGGAAGTTGQAGQAGRAGYVVISYQTRDSTSNANNGTVNGAKTTTTGQIDGGAPLASANSAYVDLGGNSSIEITGTITVEAWVSTTDLADQNRRIVSNMSASGSQNGYELLLQKSSDATYPNKFLFQVANNNTVKDAASNSAAVPGTNAYTFSTAGSSSWTVPAGVTSITVKAWGGGGGSGSSNSTSRSSGAGGGGGFAQGTITTTPGESLTVYVGGGGGGGVFASSSYAHGGGGGGYSAVTRGSSYLIQAGGGGGGSGASYYQDGRAGGAGGGASGTVGSNSTYATRGGGGTSSAGGAAGNYYSVAGSANQGGGGGNTSTSCGGSNAAGGTNGGGNGGEPYYNSCLSYASGGGGGGGGRYGGGGGGTSPYSYYSGAGAGGGSDLVTGTNTVETAGSGTAPGNNSDSNYTGSVGVGGAAVTSGNGNAGSAGYVVILATVTPTLYHLVGTYDGTTGTLYINGAAQSTSFSGASAIANSAQNVNLSRWPGTVANSYWNGMVDEVRISNTARSADWIKTEYNNQSSPSGFYALASEESSPPTVVKLASFTATGEGSRVKVEWVTKSEIDNCGFNLYRSTERDGAYLKLNQEIITGLLSSVNGRAYTFYDEDVTPGVSYCYQLEDIDLSGQRTMHGPVCVDWNAAGPGGVISSGSVTSGGKSQSTPGSGSGGSMGKGGNGSSSGSNAVNSNSFVSGMSGTSKVTQVGMRDLRAIWTDGGVLVEWSTGYEVNNLGFHVYREEGGQLVQLTPELVAGSALRSRPGTLTAGYSYSWLDEAAVSGQRSAVSTPTPTLPLQGGGKSKLDLPPGGGGTGWGGVKYWVEDIDLSGKRSWHGPVSPVFSDKPLPRRSQSALLSHLARIQAQEDPDSSRIQALKTRLSKSRSSNIMVHGVDDGSGSFTGGLIPSIISDKPPRNPSDLQWGLAASPGVKIYIQKEGWYRITQPELIAAGLSPKLNPRYLRLFVDGQEQALGVSARVGNQLGPQDALEFYATGLDTPFSDARVYWLVSSVAGKRIEQVDRSMGIGGRVTSTSFPFTVENKPRTIYFAALLNGEASNFFGPLVATAGTEQVLNVQHLDGAAPGGASLEVVLQGITVSPHQVQILVNGVEVGAVNFSGQSPGSATVSLSQEGLREGDNVVRLVAQGGEMDLSLIDTLRLTYWHTYTADNDALRLSAVGGRPLVIDGFSSSQIRVVDITDPRETREVLGRVQSEAAGYSIRLEVPGSGSRTLWAFAQSRVGKAAALEANQPSSWHQAGRGADLVILAPGDFLESLRPLKALREAQGLSVALIDVEDLYDEFSFGVKTPQAMKDFLIQARSFWRRVPGSVLLVGDATFDPRNYLGLGSYDFVPTKLIDTAYLETASDDWFVDFNDDSLPDMAVGRLPVRTAQEAAKVVSKIVGYEQGEGGSHEVLLVTDISDDVFDFEAATTALENLLPAQMTVQEIFRSRFEDDNQVQATLLQSINQGALLVNYVGHGSIEVWRGSYFDSDYAEALANGVRLPFFLDMTCLNGFFHDLYTESLAEALLKAEQGGALAVWASSGLTEPENQAPMNQEMVRLLFSGESLTLGQAAVRAKAATDDQDVRRTWILFGDPATRLKY